MRFTSSKSKITIAVLAVALLAVTLAATSCDSLGLSSDTTTPTTQPSANTVTTGETAKLAVLQRLVNLAESAGALAYLADFYVASDGNWNVQTEYFKDGSGVWLVDVDMTAVTDWNLNPYWQQAGWFVFRNGDAVPANLYDSNALRIEAEIRALNDEAAD